jgi:two-component system NtrC family sensor kinase
VGVLVLGRDKAQPNFGDEDMHFLQTMLQQVAYSVENARLYENLEHSNTELANALKTQEETQSQLLASARMAAFGELSVNIAHELNNPLTGILGYTELLLSSSVNNAQTKELLEKIRAQVVRASNITGNLLDFVTVETGSNIKTDINGLVKKAVFLAEGRMHKESIHLDLRLADQPVPVMANPAQMGQVFYNLISNALNAMTGAFKTSQVSDARDFKTEGTHRLLSIESGERGDKVYVSFKDTGPGISPENLSRIFEPFYSSQNKVSQVGLGLWVSNRIVEAHGGSISVESTPGRGSTFTVTLAAA